MEVAGSFSGGGPSFHEWRAAVDAAVAESPAVAEAIAPFGFEATGDPRYLAGRVTRYYAYVRPAPAPARRQQATEEFVDSLLRVSPSAAACFRVVIADTEVVVRDVPGTTSLYVTTVDTPKSLLETYGTYLTLTSPLIAGGQLLEAAAFGAAASARRYVYQLTIVAASLHPQQCALSQAQADTLRQLIRATPDRDPHTGAPVLTAASSSENLLLADLILPLHRRVSAFLRDGPGMRTYPALDIHSGRVHLVEASPERVSASADLIAGHYLDYGQPALPAGLAGERP